VDVDDLLEQTLWDHFWLPPWATRVERPGLIYTYSARDNPGLNMACKVRLRGAELDAAVAEVGAAHEGVLSRWLLAPASQGAEVEAALQRGGYAEEHVHDAFAVDPAAWAPQPRAGVRARVVSTADELRDLLRVGHAAFGGAPLDLSEDRVANELAACTGPDARVRRVVATDTETGQPLSAGGLNLFPDLGAAFLWGGGTVPEGRGRGAYRAVVDARLAAAAAAGCRLVGVYARHETSAPILAALGFERHGPLVSWARPAAG